MQVCKYEYKEMPAIPQHILVISKFYVVPKSFCIENASKVSINFVGKKKSVNVMFVVITMV